MTCSLVSRIILIRAKEWFLQVCCVWMAAGVNEQMLWRVNQPFLLRNIRKIKKEDLKTTTTKKLFPVVLIVLCRWAFRFRSVNCRFLSHDWRVVSPWLVSWPSLELYDPLATGKVRAWIISSVDHHLTTSFLSCAFSHDLIERWKLKRSGRLLHSSETAIVEKVSESENGKQFYVNRMWRWIFLFFIFLRLKLMGDRAYNSSGSMVECYFSFRAVSFRWRILRSAKLRDI